MSYFKITNCGNCGVKPGFRHIAGCTVARCTDCGGQDVSCNCEDQSNKPRMQVWTGIWPGEIECLEFGWFSKFKPGQGGWIRCDISDPEAGLDLNRLAVEAKWDVEKQRYVKREGVR